MLPFHQPHLCTFFHGNKCNSTVFTVYFFIQIKE